jgi:hypothetical protein
MCKELVARSCVRISWLMALLTILCLEAQAIETEDCFAAVLKLPAPPGYRYPVESDVSDYWGFYREEYGGEASCSAVDLNSDRVIDFVTFALRTDGKGFAVVVLYSRQQLHAPRIVWEDTGQVYRADDGRVEIVRRGQHTKYLGCESETSSIILPTKGIDYFNRLPYSLEQPGNRTKPEHRLFWSIDKGVKISSRNLCSVEDWAREKKNNR